MSSRKSALSSSATNGGCSTSNLATSQMSRSICQAKLDKKVDEVFQVWQEEPVPQPVLEEEEENESEVEDRKKKESVQRTKLLEVPSSHSKNS